MNTQTQTDKATDRPWKVDCNDWIYDSEGQAIASCQYKKAGKHNAALIVRAVNLLPYYEAVAEAAKLIDGGELSYRDSIVMFKALANLAAIQGKGEK